MIDFSSRSALGELGRAAGGLEAVLLSFLHSGVAGQKTGGFQRRTELRVQRQQRAGNAMTDGAGLAGNAAACYGADDIHFPHGVGGNQGLTNKQLQGIQTKIIVDFPAVDDNGAGAVFINTNPGNGAFPSSGAV